MSCGNRLDPFTFTLSDTERSSSQPKEGTVTATQNTKVMFAYRQKCVSVCVRERERAHVSAINISSFKTE